MVEINKVIYKVLTDAGLKAYPIVAPENTPLPFVVYERSLAQNVVQAGKITNDVTVTIYVLSENYAETLTINGTIDNVIQPLVGQQLDSYIYNASLLSIDEIFESGTYIQKLIYSFKVNA